MKDKPGTKQTDIVAQLIALQAQYEQMQPETIRSVIGEAIEVIETARMILGMHDDILLEDIEHEGTL